MMKPNLFRRLIKEALLELKSEKAVDRPSGPGLEQRTLMLLRALHGREDFNAGEFLNARNRILKEMAGDVLRGKASANALTGPRSDPPTTQHAGTEQYSRRDYLSRSEFISAKFDVGEPLSARSRNDPTEVALSAISEAQYIGETGGRATSTHGSRSARPPVSASLSSFNQTFEGDNATTGAARNSNQPAAVQNRRVAIRSTAIVASLLLMIAAVAAAILHFLPGWELRNTKSTMVAQSSREGKPDNSVRLNQLRQIENSVPADRLVGLGERLASEGNFYAARLILAEAVKEGSADAAISLGKTFDPHETRRATDVSAETARAWYERAKRLGSLEAQARLDRLASGKP